MRKIVYALAAACGLGGLAAGGSAALASSGPSGGPARIVITTKSYGHYDTTGDGGSATFTSPNGPVWAIDNLGEQWVITACSANPACSAAGDGANYAVTMNVGPKINGGSRFAEFADPGAGTNETSDPCPAGNPGGPHIGSGTVTGTIEWDVSSSTAPDLTGVPSAEPPATSLGTVLHQIFDGNDTETGGGHYDFSYADVCGAVYGQSG